MIASDSSPPLPPGSDVSFELHAAAAANDPHLVTRLVESGAPTDQRDLRGQAPLHHAAMTAAFEAARALIDRGADVDVEDAEGRTPLLVAVDHYDRSGPFIELMRFAGANPHAQAADGRSPVSAARARGGNVARYFTTIRELPELPALEEEPELSADPTPRRGLDRLGWRRSN